MVNYQENVYARRGLDGRGHIPALPFWVAIIRVFQFLLALIVMSLAAFAFHTFGEAASQTFLPGYSFSFFAFAWTIIFMLYVFGAPLFFPQFYLYWIHLGLECLSFIFWLTTFALLADELKYWNVIQASIDSAKAYEDKYKKYGYNYGSGAYKDEQAAVNASKAATGLAAINWLLFTATLILFSYFLHQHRVDNGATGVGGFSITRNQKPADVEATQVNNQEKIINNQPVELRNVPEYPQNPQYPHPTA